MKSGRYLNSHRKVQGDCFSYFLMISIEILELCSTKTKASDLFSAINLDIQQKT